MDRYRYFSVLKVVIFSLLAALVGVGVLGVLGRLGVSDHVFNNWLIGVVLGVLLLAIYWYSIFLSDLSSRTRFLLRLLPIVVLSALTASLVLAGFILFLIRNGWRVDVFVPAAQGSGPLGFFNRRFFALEWVGVMVLLLFFAFVSVVQLVRSLRTHHHVSVQGVRLFTQNGEWFIDISDNFLVVGEYLVLAVRGQGDVAAAVDHVSHPSSFRVSPKTFDGVIYADTDRLVSDCKAVGFVVKKKGVCWVVSAHEN